GLGLDAGVIDHPVAADDGHFTRHRLLVDDLAFLGLDVLDHVIGSRGRRLGACRQGDADDERASQRKIDLHLVSSWKSRLLPRTCRFERRFRIGLLPCLAPAAVMAAEVEAPLEPPPHLNPLAWPTAPTPT